MLRLWKQLIRTARTNPVVRASCFHKRSMTFFFMQNWG
jgi:hypothetical protein